MTAVPGMVFSIPGSWKMLARKDALVVLYILRTLYIITLYGVRVRRQYECMECSPKPWLTPLTGGPYCMRTTRGPKSDSLEKTAIINPHAMRFIVILAGGWIRSASSTSRPVEPKICALTPAPPPNGHLSSSLGIPTQPDVQVTTHGRTAGARCWVLTSRPCGRESFRDLPVRARVEITRMSCLLALRKRLSSHGGAGGKREKDGRPEQFLFSCHRLKQREDSASSREQPRSGERDDWATGSRMERSRLSAAGGPRTGRPIATPMVLRRIKESQRG